MVRLALAISFLRSPMPRSLLFVHWNREMKIASFFDQYAVAAFDMIDHPASSFKGSDMLVSADLGSLCMSRLCHINRDIEPLSEGWEL